MAEELVHVCIQLVDFLVFAVYLYCINILLFKIYVSIMMSLFASSYIHCLALEIKLLTVRKDDRNFQTLFMNYFAVVMFEW